MDISKFLKDDERVIKETATVIKELTESYELNSISKEEYDELLEDLLDMDNIDDLCDTVEQKAKVEKAFKALISIVGKVI